MVGEAARELDVCPRQLSRMLKKLGDSAPGAVVGKRYRAFTEADVRRLGKILKKA